MIHLTFEEISALAERGDEHPHLSDCADCRETARRLRALLAAAHALPSDAPPPAEVWTAVRERIVGRGGRWPARARWWHNGWMAGAAAVVLMLGTAAAVLLLTRAPTSRAKASVPALAATPAAVIAVDNNYVTTIRDLRIALRSERSALAPSTVATIDRSLRVIDQAIAEARSALAADPANQVLVDILASHYERQVDLLLRATELSASL